MNVCVILVTLKLFTFTVYYTQRERERERCNCANNHYIKCVSRIIVSQMCSTMLELCVSHSYAITQMWRNLYFVANRIKWNAKRNSNRFDSICFHLFYLFSFFWKWNLLRQNFCWHFRFYVRCKEYKMYRTVYELVVAPPASLICRVAYYDSHYC